MTGPKWIRFTLALLAPALVMAACGDETEPVPALLGEGCLLNSDCEGALVCVFRRCHVACETSEDCPLASDGAALKCVVGERPDHVCQIEDEVDCSYNSECPPDQVCGVDGSCRDKCSGDRDCVEPQTCETGTCAEEDELVDGKLPVADPPGEQETGQPCSYTSECPDGLACVEGLCNRECFEDIDCLDDELFDCEANLCVFLATCTPGETVSCACPDGSTESQMCTADGKGFEPCPCTGS